MSEDKKIIKGPWSCSEIQKKKRYLYNLMQEIQELTQKAQEYDVLSTEFATRTCAIRQKTEELWRNWQEAQDIKESDFDG